MKEIIIDAEMFDESLKRRDVLFISMKQQEEEPIERVDSEEQFKRRLEKLDPPKKDRSPWF